MSLSVSLTVQVRQAKVEMLHQVGVSDQHVEHVSRSGLHLTLDQDALAAGHQHAQLPLGGGRLPLLGL